MGQWGTEGDGDRGGHGGNGNREGHREMGDRGSPGLKCIREEFKYTDRPANTDLFSENTQGVASCLKTNK